MISKRKAFDGGSHHPLLLVGMRWRKGIEALLRDVSAGDIFTHIYVPEMVSDRFASTHHSNVHQLAARASKMYKTYLPLMPLALEQLDLRGYDLIISSESGPSKVSLRPRRRFTFATAIPNALHLEHVYDYRNSAGRVHG